MIRDIIDINDFTVLLETSSDDQTVDSCKFEEPIIAIAFYSSGDTELTVKYEPNQKVYSHTKKLALSFYANGDVEFIHKVNPAKPLNCIIIATATKNLDKLPNQEGELFSQMLNQLVNPIDNYVEGPQFYMTPEMLSIVDQVFSNQYSGKTKMMFFRSQITALLSHFFGHLANMQESTMKVEEREKLFEAKEILSNNLETPPSLSELSRQIGLNTFKLKKRFKELFGVPVFKYLQNERMVKAHQLLGKRELTVQEVAWEVGYDSLSSFSNAFNKKYGYRPSEIK